MTGTTEAGLIREAMKAQTFSYTPYSRFRVGAALLAANGKIYHGCNIENASFGATNCAERTAIFKAVSEGVTDFEAIAIVGNPEGSAEYDYCTPCGICRQVLAEFCDLDTFTVILAKSETDYRSFSLRELLPLAFTGKSMEKKHGR